MTHPPLALQLYFPTGNPQGVRMLEQAASVIKMVEVPREDLKDFGYPDYRVE